MKHISGLTNKIIATYMKQVSTQTKNLAPAIGAGFGWGLKMWRSQGAITNTHGSYGNYVIVRKLALPVSFDIYIRKFRHNYISTPINIRRTKIILSGGIMILFVRGIENII